MGVVKETGSKIKVNFQPSLFFFKHLIYSLGLLKGEVRRKPGKQRSVSVWDDVGWMKHKLESRLLGEISVTSDMQITAPLWQRRRGTKEPLDEGETGK